MYLRRSQPEVKVGKIGCYFAIALFIAQLKKIMVLILFNSKTELLSLMRYS